MGLQGFESLEIKIFYLLKSVSSGTNLLLVARKKSRSQLERIGDVDISPLTIGTDYAYGYEMSV